MAILSGTRLGAYEILGPLGAGGMGEVYRARDERLERDVAIKVLPAEVSADADRLRRFEKEARSASALNHPNIVTIHEIGSADAASYIVMELVTGQTLRELVAEGPLPTRRLVHIAAQVAQGLAKAHESGIVHRDLKPENVMITPDGHVKILDFGLAKLTQPESRPEGETRASTISAGTEPGLVMGTVGYMSPEQASGRPIDFRSDQFSFGSVLYEMATGKRAFAGATKPETLAAIIRDEPEPIAAVNPRLPAPLRWIIERCLAKEPRERYASTEDLARDLINVRDHLSEASLSSEPLAIAQPTRRSRARVVQAGMLLATLVLGLWAGRILWKAPTSSPSFQRVTFRQGALSNARFAPDGRTIVYAATWEGGNTQIYLTQVGSTESRTLLDRADLFDVSSSGELALLTPGGAPRGTLSRMPLTGGAPRPVATDISWGDVGWAPDGKELAIVRAVNGRNRLEYPIGTVLLETTKRIGAPRVSPSGTHIAFYQLENVSSIVVIDVARKQPRVLSTGWRELRGGMPAWTPDGKEIWFTAAEPGQLEALWAVSLSGKRRLVTRVAGILELFDISKDRRVLVGHHIILTRLMCQPPGEANERDLSWLDRSKPTDLSPDGKTLVFTEEDEGGGPTGSVYLRKTDGSPAIRLGEGTSAGISPDGSRVIALLPPAAGKGARLALLPTGVGEAKTLVAEGIQSVERAAFLPDGKEIVFSGNETGHGSRIYRMDVATGTLRAICPEGISVRPLNGSVLTPDGKFVLAVKERVSFLLPVAGGAPIPIGGLSPGDIVVQMTPDGGSVYVLNNAETTRKVWLQDLNTRKRRLWKELRGTELSQGASLFVTPNGDAYAYGTGQPISTCYVIDGLR